ncbi:SDR family oxidoreductase [Streptomyces sp. NPDC093594]|uniref:SDR family NAD(P)-dependent oxidoreductase n=1 Tax=Streptomyces sp. NPDC093594 TaxID=3155305 RepID=UPI003450FCC5
MNGGGEERHGDVLVQQVQDALEASDHYLLKQVFVILAPASNYGGDSAFHVDRHHRTTGGTDMNRLEGRAALVTGSTSGIGRGVAEAMAREGAIVVVTGLGAERGAQVVDGIVAEGGIAHFVEADLSGGGSEIRRLAQEATALAGRPIDVLVNNAAYLVPPHPMTESTEEQIDQVLEVNIKAPYLLTATLVPGMVENGGGSVINMGSIGGVEGIKFTSLYGASKAGLHSLTRSWAAELAADGVRVNTVAPGPTLTESNDELRPLLEKLAQSNPDRRTGSVQDTAAAVIFLASEDASHIHGVLLPVDGGALAI